MLFIILSYIAKCKQISPIFDRVQWGDFLKALILLGLRHFLEVQNLPTKWKTGKKRPKISPICVQSPTTDGAIVVGETRMCTGFEGFYWWFGNLPSNVFYRDFFLTNPFKKMWNTEKVEQMVWKAHKYGLCGCSSFFWKMEQVPLFLEQKWNREGFRGSLGELGRKKSHQHVGVIVVTTNAPFASLTTLLHGKCQRMSGRVLLMTFDDFLILAMS